MRKIIIEAPRRSGKSRQCLRRAKRLAAKGEKILYIQKKNIDRDNILIDRNIYLINTEGRTLDMNHLNKKNFDHLIIDDLTNVDADEFININKSKFRISSPIINFNN